MTRKSLCSRLKSGLEHSCWTGSPPVCERPRATKADLFRAGLQVQRASNVNRRAKRPGQSNKNPVRNVDHVRSYFRKQTYMAPLEHVGSHTVACLKHDRCFALFE